MVSHASQTRERLCFLQNIFEKILYQSCLSEFIFGFNGLYKRFSLLKKPVKFSQLQLLASQFHQEVLRQWPIETLTERRSVP